MKYTQGQFMYYMSFLYLFSLRKGFQVPPVPNIFWQLPNFMSGLDVLLYSRLVHPQCTWQIHVTCNRHLQLHISQLELLIYPTPTPVPLTVFFILVNDNIIIPVAQARNLGVILALSLSLTLNSSGFRMHKESDHFLPPHFTTRVWASNISCLDLWEEPLSSLSALIFAPLQSVLNTAARPIL